MSAADDIARIRARMERMQANLTEMGPGLMRAGAVLAKGAMDAIEAGGPGWPPNKAGTPLLIHFGRLLNTLAPQNSVALISDGVRVTAGTDYAGYLQNGTGVFAGHSPWSRPRHKTQGPSKPRQGMPPRKFLFINEERARRMRDILAAHIMGRPLDG